MRFRCTLLLFALAQSFSFAAETTNASPKITPLHASENGHYLVDPSGKPVFLLADTAWGLTARLKREDIVMYLRHRRAQGFNAIAISLYSPAALDIADAASNAYGHAPFATENGRPNPAKPLAFADDGYWEIADYAIAEAERLGLYVITLPCWGSAVTGGYNGEPTPEPVFDEASGRAYAKWIAQRYAAHPNVLWMLGGDRRAVYKNRDFRPVFRAMVEGLREGGATQLASFHPPKLGPQSGDWFHTDSWLGFNSIQQWPEDQLSVITRDWNATPPKPTWVFEGRYEGYWRNNHKAEDWSGWQCRQQEWQTVLAGAFGFTYGHERIYGFGKEGADWKQFLDAPGAACMVHLAKLLATWPADAALTRIPDQSLIVGDAGKAGRRASDRVTATRSGDSRIAMIYSANGRSFTLRMDRLGAPALDAYWFNPRTGLWKAGNEEVATMKPAIRAIPSGQGAATCSFTPPSDAGNENDWVLVLR